MTSGLVFFAKAVRRRTVTCDSFSKVGSALNVASSSWSRDAVASKTRLEFVISAPS